MSNKAFMLLILILIYTKYKQLNIHIKYTSYDDDDENACFVISFTFFSRVLNSSQLQPQNVDEGEVYLTIELRRDSVFKFHLRDFNLMLYLLDDDDCCATISPCLCVIDHRRLDYVNSTRGVFDQNGE